MVRLAYHFSRPSANQPAAEWAYHLAAIQAAGGFTTGDGDALDIEDTAVAAGVNLAPWCEAYLGANTAFRTMLYSGNWYMQPHGLEADPQLAQYPLWYASWQQQEPTAPWPWPLITIWQNAAGVAIPSAQNADTDLFYGTAAQLQGLGMPPPTKQPFDCAARLQLTGYVAGGSGVADLIAWLGGYE